MTQTVVGHARCGTDEQDLAAQRQALAELGLPEDRALTADMPGPTVSGPSLARP